MKNERITALIIMPAEPRPEEFATYLSALAAWATKDPENLEAVFQMYREDTKSEDSFAERMKFTSFFFFECMPGIDFLASLRRNRRTPLTTPAGNLTASAMPACYPLSALPSRWAGPMLSAAQAA